MSVEKFRFVSPGVYVNEIDNSRLPRAPDEVGPVIIGRSQRGPILRPVRVESYSDFVDVFGETSPGGMAGDVWRNGNKTAPTYGSYAARAYLRNAGAVTFVRLGGYENNKKQATGAAGWSTGKAYGLFVVPVTETALNKYSDTGDAALAAVIYASGSNYGLKGTALTASTTIEGLNKFVLSSAGDLQLDIIVNGATKTVNFNKDSRNYIRNVLNTNATLTNNKIVSAPEDYFLGETFRTFANDNAAITSTGKYAAVLVQLTTAGGTNFSNFKEEAKNSTSGWVVAQHKGAASTFQWATSSLGPKKLFRVVGLSEGEWNSQNIKISIEDIKLPPNEFIKYGSFTLSIRRIDDDDISPKYLERFTNLSLDRFSDNYIAKRIGDKYTEWDYDNKLFNEYGEYNNNSRFIRIEMDDDVAAGGTESDLVPFGFWLQDTFAPELSAGSGSSHMFPTPSYINSGLSGTIVAQGDITASFKLPEIPLLDSSNNSVASSLTSVYFGLKTTVGATKKYNEDIVDLVRSRPKGFETDPKKVSYKLFTLDEVSGTISSGVLDRSAEVKWVSGSRKAVAASASLTANGYVDQLLKYCNRFTMPLFGGSDGVDITEKDPFNKRVLNSKDEFTSYAYNSVKVAIDSVADAEVVECNLMAIPGIDNSSLTDYLIDRCEARGDALAVIDLDGDYTPEEGKEDSSKTIKDRKPDVDSTITKLKARSLNSSYGCAFFPWVLIRDTTNNNTVWVPPSVAALGTFASSQVRTELWFAPAGFNRGGLSDGAAGIPVIQTALRLTSRNRDDLYENNINPIATFPNEGIVIFGQKTLQVTPSALDRINVRRLMIYLKKEVSRMARVVLFDPNLEITWRRFTNMVNPFLNDVKTRFGLSDFRVVLDSTTTTPDLVDRNIVYAKILLKPTRAIEFIALDFVIAPTGASFDD